MIETDRDLTFKALAEPLRRDILDLLRAEPRTTGEICEAFGALSRFGVMNHLGVLKRAGLIVVEKRGRERINRLQPAPLRAAYEDWMREYEVLWAGRLGRLKRVAETRVRGRDMDESAWVGAPLASLLIRQSVDIAAAPATVYKALTEDIGYWWGAPYLITGEDARDVVLDARPGGLMTEVTEDGGQVWCMVEQARPGRCLVLGGRMGMRDAVAGNIRFELVETAGGTQVQLEHRAVGGVSAETERDFGAGWEDLLGTRLKGYVEEGAKPGIRGGR